MKLEVFAKNPFLATEDGLVVKTKKQFSQVKMGRDESPVLGLLTEHGEVKTAQVSTFKEVDGEAFIKLYTGNIKLLFDLTRTAYQVFNILLHVVQKKAIAADEIYFSYEQCLEFCEEFSIKKISNPTFYRGVKELAKHSIIARATRPHIYFINPHVLFNGDRVAFISAFKKKKFEQIDMFEEQKKGQNETSKNQAK